MSEAARHTWVNEKVTQETITQEIVQNKNSHSRIVVRRHGGNCEEIFVEYAQQRKRKKDI